VGIVARLDSIKNHALLLRALDRVREHLPCVRLLVIGDGPLHGELESLTARLNIRANVTFLGTRNDVPDLLAALDLFILSSISESLSLTLIECCAAGKPIVATDVGGNREIVRHGQTGLLVPPDDDGALANAITEILSDPARGTRMGRAARTRFEEEFTLEVMAAKYRTLYEDLAAKRTSTTIKPKPPRRQTERWAVCGNRQNPRTLG
jgi:glycosyltransferase involved in cell wall biosynthesis